MVLTKREKELEQFAKRLNEALDDAQYPAKYVGRQSQLSRDMKVTQKTCQRWLAGDAMPSVKRLAMMADLLGVNFEWLANGKGSKRGESVEKSSSTTAKTSKIIRELQHLDLHQGIPSWGHKMLLSVIDSIKNESKDRKT